VGPSPFSGRPAPPFAPEPIFHGKIDTV
jgi:hypothetical protein